MAAKSSGHPLSLLYLLRLIAQNPASSPAEFLDNEPVYKGDIASNYLIYWKEIENNDPLINFFALLSRMRTPINPQVVSRWCERSTIRSFISSASHYFRKENNSRWHFFHNSFRQFILDKTSRNAFGHPDETLHVGYHAKLAELCSQADDNNIWHWEKLHHLYHAKRWNETLSIGQQEYFREQFFNLRHFEDIIDDIAYVLLSAKAVNQPLPIVRCLLIEAELNERQQMLNQEDTLNLIFSTVGLDAVLVYMFDGSRLRVQPTEALVFAKALVDGGFLSEARRIFIAAEPLTLLSGSETVGSMHGERDVLKAWVDMAHYFIGFEDIVSAIQQTRYAQDSIGISDDDKLHFSLISKLINSIYKSSNEEAINSSLSHLKIMGLDEHMMDISFSVCLAGFPSSQVDRAFARIQNWATDNALSDSEKIRISELVLKVTSDQNAAREWLNAVKQPDLYEHHFGGWEGLSPFSDRIRLNRLYSAFGCEVEPEIAVPNAGDPTHQGAVLFERNLVSFANIWGKKWHDEAVNPVFIEKAIQRTFRLFTKQFIDTRHWDGWHELARATVDFYKFTIKAVSQHGIPCILSLAEVFRSEWEKHAWQTRWRREIAFALYQAGDAKENLIACLDSVERQISEDSNFRDRMSEYTDMAKIWKQIGEHDRAKNLLQKVMKSSFGIYYDKDSQFSLWVSWLGRVVNDLTEPGDIRRYSAALINLQLSGSGSETQEASRDFMAIVISWNIEYGLELMNWLFDKKGLHYAPGLTGFLLGMLNRANPPLREIAIVTNKLLIPFERYNPSDLPELLTIRCYEHSADPDAVECIKSIAKSISTNLLPSNRCDWWKGIFIGLRKLGCDSSEVASKWIPTPEKALFTLHTNEKLTEKAAMLKVDSARSLITFLKSVKSASYYDWLDFIQPYLPMMDKPQLVELNNLISPFNCRDSVLGIANQLVEIGESAEANTVMSNLLGSSVSKNWEYIGSRISTFKTLVAIDPVKWRPAALQSLIDYLSEHNSGTLIEKLETIVDIIFEDPDYLLIWPEIREHIYQLNDFNDTVLPPLPSNKNSNMSDVDFLVRLSFQLLDKAVPELALMAHQTIVAFVDESHRLILIDELKKRLSKFGIVQIKALAVLSDVADEYTDFVAIFGSEITALCMSNDLSVRTMAIDLANILSIDGAPIPKARRELPFTYKIELPELKNIEEAIPLSAIMPREVLPDFGDDLEMIQPFLNHVILMAKMAEIPLQNLVTRISELVRTLAPEEQWNRQAEEKHREWLFGIDLKLSYLRPQTQMVKRALSYVACELMDTQSISINDARFLSALFRTSDHCMLRIEPVERANFIEIPTDTSNEVPNHDKWLEAASDRLQLFKIANHQNQTILGELTQWCWLDWERRTETRLSMVCHSAWRYKNANHAAAFFPHMPHWTANDYPNFQVDKPTMVIYGSPTYADHGGAKWLALNPVVGFSLGWNFSGNGLFRWENRSGEIMVESIFWKDGPMNRQTHRDNLCSDGWLVVATPAAVNSICQLEKETIKIDAVIRCYGDSELKYATAEARNQWEPNC